MANTSILAAFERMWQHVVAVVGNKSDLDHTHDDIYYTEVEVDTKLDTINTSISNIANGSVMVAKAEEAVSATSATSAINAEKLGGQSPSYYAKSSDIPTGSLASKSIISESDLDSALAEKVNAASEGNHSHSNKTVLDGITSAKVSNWDSSLDSAKEYTDTVASGKADKTHNHDTVYDTKGSANAVQSNLDVVSDELAEHVDNADIHFTAAERTKLSGIATGANKYSHPNSGVTAGTYKSVTVNAQGHVTGGTNPTTLAGYGITDAASATALAELTETVNGKANSSHIHTIANVTNLQSSLDSKVPTTRTINGKALTGNITLSASDVGADASGSASAALTSAQSYTDSAVATVKNDLLNGAGTAYDTLKELGDLIDDNKDAIDALETVAAGKADKTHAHAISDITNLQSTLDGKAASSHGTHVSYSSTAPVMDGTASVGTANTVARSDHKHPTDTSRASKTEFDTHVSDTTKHITSTERTNWGTAYTHSQAAHAPSNAQANQNAFSNVKIGDTTIAADTTTDTLTIEGSNVTITPDATNDKITIAVADASTSTAGIVKLTNSTSSTSTTTAATPNSVKSAYDLANTAKTNAATAQTRADAAYSLAEGKVDSLSDLGITATATELNYVDGVTSNIQTQLDGKSASGHTHNYAGSSSAGGAATSANKVNSSLTVKLNSGTTEGTNMFTFNGSAAKAVNITPAAIGAATSSHTHDDRYYTESEIDTKVSTLNTAISGKAASSHTHAISDVTNLQTTLDGKVPTSRTVNGKALSANITLSASDVGAAASSHNHNDSYYTETEIDTKLSGKANSSHGNHVPTVQTASNNTFLRNDNTWATVTPANIGAAASSHTHTKSQITDFPASLKNPNALTIQGNGTTLTNGTYDGSAAKTVNITPSSIGAATSSHTHDDRYYTESEIDSKVSTLNTAINGKADSSHTHNYAGSSSAGGSATKVAGTLTNPSSATLYPIPFHSSVSTGDKSLLNNDGLRYQTREGTTSQNGFSVLTLGNSTTNGTAGNKYGEIHIYSKTAYRGKIQQQDVSSDVTHKLPTTGGTLLNDKDFTVSNGVLTLNFL